MKNISSLRAMLTGFFLMLAALQVSAEMPSAPQLTQRAHKTSKRLARQLHVRSEVQAGLQACVLRHEQAVTGLDGQQFASPAEASAAYTVVEATYYNELTRLLTPEQFQSFLALDTQPAATSGSMARR